jgi:phage shock protein C
MYCSNCGIKLDDKANYCSDCGTAAVNTPRRFNAHLERRLTRARDDVRVAGVCAGFARYLGIDVTLIRILWVILTIFSIGVGLIVYIACWIVMPKEALALPAGTMNPAQSHS